MNYSELNILEITTKSRNRTFSSIVVVNFCFCLTWLEDSQAPGKTVFLGDSMWISRPRKDRPDHGRWASFSPFRNGMEQNGRGRAKALCWSWDLYLFCPLISVLLFLRLLDSHQDLYHQSSPSHPFPRPLSLDWITPLAFLVLHIADGRSWDLSSTITWANVCNKSPLM